MKSRSINIKGVCLLAAITFTIISAMGQTSIRIALANELTAYPKSQLRDVYKNFFQDNFGPGHILNDTVAAGKYLRSELESTKEFEGPLYEPTGNKGNFYRVNLSLIKDGIVDYDTYFSAFVRSVRGIVQPSANSWRNYWKEIDSEIRDLGLSFVDEHNDRLHIAERLASGDFAVHHSHQFDESYNFHYRIISREIFENEILPLILTQLSLTR